MIEKMNIKKIKFLIIVFIIAICLFSCEKEEINHSENNNYTIELISGNNQKGFINQELNSAIKFMVKDNKNQIYKKAIISYQPNNGILFNTYYTGDTCFNYWLTDCTLGVQSAFIVVKDSEERLIDTIEVSCFVEKDSLWNRACGIPPTISSSEFVFPTIQKIVKSPDNALYVPTYNYYSSIYRSVDDGETWEEFLDLEPYLWVHDLTIDPIGNIFLSSDKGLFKLQGNNSIKKVMEESIDKCFSIDEKTLFACGYLRHFIYRSDDRGETWNKITIPYINRYDRMVYTEAIEKLVRIDDSKILLLNSDGEMLLSNNNGESWSILDNTESFWDITGFYIMNNYIYLVNIYGAESIPYVYKSDLSGSAWNLFCILTRRPHNYYEVTEITSYKNDLFILTDNCIYQINEVGDTLNITNQVWSKIKSVNNFEISSNGNIIVGNQHKQTGIFYKKL